MSAVAFALWSDVGLTPEVRQFADRLVQYVAAHVRDIDASLVDVTTNWRLERLGAIERAVLRLASAELALGDAPPRVVLQEAIYLAERFGTERSARFVNGVLDAVARRMGRL
jgi:N utilization substance protein B